jgi:glycosyltransferase involved in cell wall biosynthesis
MTTRDTRLFRRLLDHRRPALIHAQFGVDGSYALPLAQKLGIPLVTMFHGFDATLSSLAMLCSPAWAHYPLQRRQLAKRGDLFLCSSAFIRDRLLALGFPSERTRVHYIGVDLAKIPLRSPEQETPSILHVARLVDVKGSHYLIQAFARLAAQHPAVELIIIGDGPRRSALERLAQSLGLAARVRFLGALPHAGVLGWMRRAAILALPSVTTWTGRTEGRGQVLVEAAASGLPLVGSVEGGIPEVIIDGVNGRLCAPRNVDQLAARIDELLRSPELRRRMGRAGRERVATHFDIARQTRILEDYYDELTEVQHGRRESFAT